MYSYVLLANLEENLLKQTVISLDKEGYVPLKSRGDWLIMRKGDDDRNREDEEKMAEVMFQMMKRMRFDVPYSDDISNIFNRHYDRLHEERFSRLKFNDTYIWELRQFLAIAKLKNR